MLQHRSLISGAYRLWQLCGI